jgi:hypothetical protein
MSRNKLTWADVPAIVGRPVLLVIMVICVPWTIIDRIWTEVKSIPFYVWCDLRQLGSEFWRDFKSCGERFR